jgi:hypothetical protein
MNEEPGKASTAGRAMMHLHTLMAAVMLPPFARWWLKR